jgi:hypothetical protein
VSVNRTAIYVTGSERIAVCVEATADINTIAEVLCVLTVSALYKTIFWPDCVSDPNTSFAILNVVIKIQSGLPHQ